MPSMVADKYRFFTGIEFYNELISRIKTTKPGDRVVLVTLFIKPEDELISKLFDALKAAAQRGVRVILLMDMFAFLIKKGISPGPAYFFGDVPNIRLTKFFRERLLALKDLEAAGVEYRIINKPIKPLASPFKDRSHLKFSLVGDYVFLGGCNLGSTKNTDIMVGWQDKKIADWLDGFAQKVKQTGRVRDAMAGKDRVLPVDGKTEILIDAGVSGNSVILDRALDIIDNATKSLIITLQYFPQGVTAKHLAGAVARGVKLRTFYNSPYKHVAPLNVAFALKERLERVGMPPELSNLRLAKRTPYLHAKLLANESEAMLGSHNYMMHGVHFGTAEIAIVSTDPKFVRLAVATMSEQLPKGVARRSGYSLGAR